MCECVCVSAYMNVRAWVYSNTDMYCNYTMNQLESTPIVYLLECRQGSPTLEYWVWILRDFLLISLRFHKISILKTCIIVYNNHLTYRFKFTLELRFFVSPFYWFSHLFHASMLVYSSLDMCSNKTLRCIAHFLALYFKISNTSRKVARFENSCWPPDCKHS